MKDRIPKYPGRVRLIPVEGQPGYYDMVRADEPEEVGTPLNKASLLSDETAEAYDLGVDGTVNDALAVIPTKISNSRVSTFEKILTGRLI